MDAHAEECLVTDYEHRIEALSLPDPDDRHVLAAAIEADAEFIVTLNLKDFPAAALALYGLEAIGPDAFLCDLFQRNPGAVCEAVRNQRAALKNPPKTVDELLATLAQTGLPLFVAALNGFKAKL